MRQRREIHSGVASSMVHRVKKDRRRRDIEFEIPVTRGAFDQRREAPMTEGITEITIALAEMSCETQIA